MPRDFASFATSMASIERAVLSGSEWTWMSIAPFRVCPKSAAPLRKSSPALPQTILVHKFIDLSHHSHIILRLPVVRQEAVDFLFHIGQLRVTESREGRNFRNR